MENEKKIEKNNERFPSEFWTIGHEKRKIACVFTRDTRDARTRDELVTRLRDSIAYRGTLEERRYHWWIKERPYPRPRSANVTRTPIRYCASRRHFANRSLLSHPLVTFLLNFCWNSFFDATNSNYALCIFMTNRVYTLCCNAIIIIFHLFLITYFLCYSYSYINTWHCRHWFLNSTV